MAVYILDTNFFISAHRYHYPLDIAVSFWEKIKLMADTGKIISTINVRNELYSYERGKVQQWCKDKLMNTFFHEIDDSVFEKYAFVAQWAGQNKTHFQPTAIREFLDDKKADAFLIAYALCDPAERVLCTYEVSKPNQKKKIQIPDACSALNVKCINPMAMFRALGETF